MIPGQMKLQPSEVGRMVAAYCAHPANKDGGCLRELLSNADAGPAAIRHAARLAQIHADADAAPILRAFLSLSRSQRQRAIATANRLHSEAQGAVLKQQAVAFKHWNRSGLLRFRIFLGLPVALLAYVLSSFGKAVSLLSFQCYKAAHALAGKRW